MGSVKQQSTPIKIVVADDHPVVVMGVSKMIGELDGIRVVATATTISQLFECLSKAHCDILVCDYSFENDNEPDGLLLLDKVRRFYPEVKIILLTAHDDLVIVQRAVKAGVSGFLSKSSNDMSLISSVIARVYSGEKYLDPLTSKAMLQHMMSGELSVPTLLTSNLTARELEVVRMFSRGMSVTDIAHYTDRSIKTISTQKKQAMLKLGACNDVELVNAFGKLF
jgi:two-component system capsular synthesis response regulator RcsB